jgi:hypothetical protein
MIFWIILMQDWTEGKWEGFYNKQMQSLQIAVILLRWTELCRDTTGINCSSILILQFESAELQCFSGVTWSFPEGLRMKPAKLHLPRSARLYDNYFISSGVECLMFLDHPGRCRQSYGCTLNVPETSLDIYQVSAGFWDHIFKLLLPWIYYNQLKRHFQ